MKAFPANLRFLRKLRGLKQGAMEELLAVKDSTWNNYETGRSHPNLFGFVKICSFFKVNEYTMLHIDIAANPRLADMISEAVARGETLTIESPVAHSALEEPAESYSQPAILNEVFKRVIDLETDMRFLKQKLRNKI